MLLRIKKGHKSNINEMEGIRQHSVIENTHKRVQTWITFSKSSLLSVPQPCFPHGSSCLHAELRA